MDDDSFEKFNQILSKYIKKDQVNHAYLLETNSDNKLDLAKILINKILSFDNMYNYDDLLKNGDLLIIDTDSNMIKAEEIELIKERFKTKSLINSKRIYVINNAEKLNNYAANKLLKFLEEPEEDIISILITENKNNMINTIVSRCFNIRFFINEEKKYDDEYIDKLFEFIMNIENNNEKAIAFQNNYELISDRVILKNILNDMLVVYDNVINYKVSGTCNVFNKKIDIIKKICDDNNINDLKIKINAINDCIEKLKYNPNIKLLIDKLIILMSGVDINA
jgi:DNA polymerase III gamma/tau subunit